MRKTDDKPLQDIATAAQCWVVPGTVRVECHAEIISSDPDQVITRPLPEGGYIPEENEVIYFSSQEAAIPAFVDESQFDSYCEEHGFDDELPSDGLFSAVNYLAYGQTFAGDEIFLGGFGSAEKAEAVSAALTKPVQSLIDAGLLTLPQPDCGPEL